LGKHVLCARKKRLKVIGSKMLSSREEFAFFPGKTQEVPDNGFAYCLEVSLREVLL